jgi:hypothetical protein
MNDIDSIMDRDAHDQRRRRSSRFRWIGATCLTLGVLVLVSIPLYQTSRKLGHQNASTTTSALSSEAETASNDAAAAGVTINDPSSAEQEDVLNGVLFDNDTEYSTDNLVTEDSLDSNNSSSTSSTTSTDSSYSGKASSSSSSSSSKSSSTSSGSSKGDSSTVSLPGSGSSNSGKGSSSNSGKGSSSNSGKGSSSNSGKGSSSSSSSSSEKGESPPVPLLPAPEVPPPAPGLEPAPVPAPTYTIGHRHSRIPGQVRTMRLQRNDDPHTLTLSLLWSSFFFR